MGESGKLQRYQKLAQVLEDKGYTIKFIDPDWYKPLSDQTFVVEKQASVGHSHG